MDQEESYPQEELPDQNNLEPEYQKQESVTVAPPLEGAFSKYLREYRLLNSLLVSLLFLTIIMASIWGMMMGIALSGEGNSDFSDGGTAPTAQKQEKQKSNIQCTSIFNVQIVFRLFSGHFWIGFLAAFGSS